MLYAFVMKERFYVTTAIPYANGAPHIGHAYERIATDAIQRFMRLDGRDVLFVTGMDEYGLKVQQTAAKAGLKPQAFVDGVAAEFEAMGELLNARADDIVRTTQKRQTRAVQELWKRMAANGDIYLSKYSGWYSVRDEAYYDEGELTAQPDGTKLAPTGSPVSWVEEESYFFKLSAYADKLLAHYAANPAFVTPDKYLNEIVAFVKRGLEDVSISRTTFDWGQQVPGDPRHVMYVWLDALTNYLTATGFPDEGPKTKFWPADVHVIGKDITRFHAIYWPAFLLSAGLPTPKQIVVHGFLFNKGEKMSKSVGNVVSPASLVETYGLDALRYFFLRETPWGQDGSYSDDLIVSRMNADLANDLGNLAQRCLSIVARNGAAVPEPGPLDEADRAMLANADALVVTARALMRQFQLSLYIGAVMEAVAAANRYFANAEPWKLAKSDPARMRTVLYVTMEVLRAAAVLLQPVMPGAMGKLLDLLGVAADARLFDRLGGEGGRLTPGAALPPPAVVFPRYVTE